MSERIAGRVSRVNGPVLEAADITDALMTEMVYVGEQRLVGEVIKLNGNRAVIQVYEDTTGIAPGDNIYGSGESLSVSLGPGLMGTIYDGIQRPLEKLFELSGEFIGKGLSFSALNREKEWEYTPLVTSGDRVKEGQIIGTVQETQRIEHRIMVPPGISGTVVRLAEAGSYTIDKIIAVVEPDDGDENIELTMMQSWPIRRPRPTAERRPLSIPLVTGQRVIDTLSSPCQGGDCCHSGGIRNRKDNDPACHRQVV